MPVCVRVCVCVCACVCVKPFISTVHTYLHACLSLNTNSRPSVRPSICSFIFVFLLLACSFVGFLSRGYISGVVVIAVARVLNHVGALCTALEIGETITMGRTAKYATLYIHTPTVREWASIEIESEEVRQGRARWSRRGDTL